MASALLRMSARWGSAFRRVVSAAAAPAAAPSGGEGLAVSLPPRPLHRLLSSGALGDQPPKSLEEKVDLLHQTMKEVNHKIGKGFLIYAGINKLVEERRPHNRFAQWLWQVGAVTFIVFVEQWRARPERRTRP